MELKNLFDEPLVVGKDDIILLTTHESLGPDVEVNIDEIRRQLTAAGGEDFARRCVVFVGMSATMISKQKTSALLIQPSASRG